MDLDERSPCGRLYDAMRSCILESKLVRVRRALSARRTLPSYPVRRPLRAGLERFKQKLRLEVALGGLNNNGYPINEYEGDCVVGDRRCVDWRAAGFYSFGKHLSTGPVRDDVQFRPCRQAPPAPPGPPPSPSPPLPPVLPGVYQNSPPPWCRVLPFATAAALSSDPRPRVL